MSANMRKLMEEVPRPLEIVAHDDARSAPVGRKPLSRTESNRRTGQYLGAVVSGQIPLDEQAADVVKEYLDAYHARQ